MQKMNLISLKEAAKIFHKDVSTLRRKCRNKKPPCEAAIKIGSMWVLPYFPQQGITNGN